MEACFGHINSDMSLFEIRSKLLLFLHRVLFCQTRIVPTDVLRCNRCRWGSTGTTQSHHICFFKKFHRGKKNKTPFAASQRTVILHTWASSTGRPLVQRALASLSEQSEATTFHTMKSSGRGRRGGRGGVGVEDGGLAFRTPVASQETGGSHRPLRLQAELSRTHCQY